MQIRRAEQCQQYSAGRFAFMAISPLTSPGLVCRVSLNLRRRAFPGVREYFPNLVGQFFLGDLPELKSSAKTETSPRSVRAMASS